MRRNLSKLLVVLCTLALVATACGGSDNESPFAAAFEDDAEGASDVDDSSPDTSGDTSDSGDAGSESVAIGPIEGPMFSTGSFGLGLFVIDEATGEITELETNAVEGIDRNSDVVVTAEAAFVLGVDQRADTEYSSDVSLVRVDRTTGEFRVLAPLGYDRETDDSTDSSFFDIVGAGGNSVFVTTRTGGDETWRHFDATTGAEIASFPVPSYDFSDDSSSCSFDVRPQVFSDGSLVGVLDDLPGTIDSTTGIITELPGGRSCGDISPSIADYVAADEMDAFNHYLDGVPIPWADWDPFFWGSVTPDSDLVEGDGHIWWYFEESNDTVNFDDLPPTQGLMAGIVQYDPINETIVAVHPLGAYAGEFLGLNENDNMEITRPQFEMTFAEGRLIMVDRREDAPTLIWDPATGDVIEIVYAADGADFVTAELLATKPGEVWVTVGRATIISDDDNGRQSSSDLYSERIDPMAGAVVASLSWAEI